MEQTIKRLLNGSSKNPYPLYCQYVHSDGETLTTSNGDVFVKLDRSLDFKGCINTYILANIAKSFGYEFNLKQHNDKVLITRGRYQHGINIVDIDMPDIPQPKCGMVDIDEELLNALKFALKFTGSNGIYSYVCVSQNDICATDGARLFYRRYEIPDVFDGLMGVDKRIYNMIDIGHAIGVRDHNVVIEFENGYAIVASSILNDNFPYDNIKDFVHQNSGSNEKVCNVAFVVDSIDKLMPIMFGEKSSTAKFEGGDGVLRITTESALNGLSFVDFEIETQASFTFYVDLSFFKNIPLNYNMYIRTDTPAAEHPRVILSDEEDSLIILMGKRNE